MEIRMTEQCFININNYDERMRNEWKLEWLNNAEWLKVRMTKQCAINEN